MRDLIVVLGDQLTLNSPVFDHFDPAQDVVWMAEATEESTHVWTHKARIALFLSAMRHFRDNLRRLGWNVDYRTLDDPANRGSLRAELQSAIERLRPRRVLAVESGEFRVQEELARVAQVEFLEDRHFLCSRAEFARHTEGRKQLRMEFFYREMRRRYGILMEGKEPAGGRWNFDSENRESFSKSGPPSIPAPVRFAPDETTRQVIALIEQRFPGHPGQLRHFDWPVTAQQARAALDDFIANRLPFFGLHQDAMWTGEPYLYHSRISAALNLKLLDPRDAIAAAEQAWRSGQASLPSVEGFIRQILGWREYVRGIYWQFMPEYANSNALDAHAPLPDFYWTGETGMNCLRHAIGQTLEHGYAHHIQRLMVTGLYALLAGVDPRAVHEWYLAVYVDAVEWVELPNTIGMSQFADGGVMASKPYAATGKYIQRMSNYCTGCRYQPDQVTGERACPFTTLYWDFLLRNEPTLSKVPRMELQLRNLERITPARKAEIQAQAARHRKEYECHS